VTIVGDIKSLHNTERNTIAESQKALTESVGSYQKAIETERKNTALDIKRISTALTSSLKTIYTDISQIQDDIST
jgi:hypothetical protein